MRAKGQQQKYPPMSLRSDIELYGSIRYSCKNSEKLTLTHEELWMMPQTDKDCRHRELFIRLCKVEYIANF